MMMMVTGILLTMRMMLQGGRCPLCCDQELYEYELHEQYLRQVIGHEYGEDDDDDDDDGDVV